MENYPFSILHSPLIKGWKETRKTENKRKNKRKQKETDMTMMNKMHKLAVCLCGALMGVLTAGCGGDNQPQKLLLGGSGWNKLVIIDKATQQVEWEHPLEKGWECNSAVSTPQGHILFSYARGAKLIDRQHNELWNIAAPDSCEMQTARLLPDGNFLLGWVGHPAVILEVSPKGEVLHRTEYETGIDHPHAQFRQLAKNERGNYLMPLFATSDVREISPAGELVRTTRLEGTPFTTLPSAQNEGLHWVACGDGHSLQEVNLDNGQVARRYGETDIEGVRLFFVAGLWPVADGGLYVCNWQGHDPRAVEANSPQVFQLDKQGRVVWSLNDNQRFGMISTICEVED